MLSVSGEAVKGRDAKKVLLIQIFLDVLIFLQVTPLV
jgi:hypothetical protein